MRVASSVAVLLFVIAAAFFIYSMMITPRMDSGLSEQGYRPPIQDQAPEPKSKPSLQKSNVPPASEMNK